MDTVNPIAPLWQIWRNPFFRRHAVARLRWMPLISWLLVVQVIGGFLWCVAFLVYLRVRTGDTFEFAPGTPAFSQTLHDHGKVASLIAWAAVLVLQGLIWFLKGTFSVATGMARESNEGMIEAERLTPLPVSHKVLGQLLGMPIFETVLVLSLLPWALVTLFVGGHSPAMMLRVYLLFATSAMFHHSVGLVAGMIIRQKILAGTLSQVLVICLHFVLPFFGGLGLGPLAHLPMEGAIVHEVARDASPEILKAMDVDNERGVKPVRFHDWVLDPSGYQWTVTAMLLGFLVTIPARRWKDGDSQLLGKAGTVLLAGALLTLGSGELLPKIKEQGVTGLAGEVGAGWVSLVINDKADGQSLESLGGKKELQEEIERHGYERVASMIGPSESLRLGVLWAGACGSVLCGMAMILAAFVTPSEAAAARVRRQLIRHAPVSWRADGRPAWLWVTGLALMAAGVWVLLFDAVCKAPDTGGLGSLSAGAMARLVIAIAVPALAWHGLLVWQGAKRAVPVAFVTGVVPLLVGIVAILAGADAGGWVKWVAGISGVVLPALAAVDSVSLSGAPLPLPGMHAVFLTSLTVHALAALGMFLRVRVRSRPRGVGETQDLKTQDARLEAGTSIH